jgi:hypothetical protein
MVPNDLNDKDGSSIALELFGRDPNAPSSWWELVRLDERTLEWRDQRLGIGWKVTHGFLVALREVSKSSEATNFAAKNKIRLLPNGGFYFRNTAELFVRCVGLPSPEEIVSQDDLYRIKTKADLEASVGYSSQLFVRLVGSPAAELSRDVPDPYSLTTLVLSPVEKDQVEGAAELALYHLRRRYPSLELSFWPFNDLKMAPHLPEHDSVDAPGLADNLPDTERTEAIAFYNRAMESPPIPGFLYLYRVLESCFDDVLSTTVSAWRHDATLSDFDLLQNIRNIQRSEDVWSLRQVLREIVDQKLLDAALGDGIIDKADADTLAREIYLRRNSIAHGRKGQHRHVLVPLGYSFGDEAARERSWYQLIKTLAEKSMEKWLFSRT